MNNMTAKRAKRSNLLVSSFLNTVHDDNDSCCDRPTDEYDLDKYEVELANSPGSVNQLTECQSQNATSESVTGTFVLSFTDAYF